MVCLPVKVHLIHLTCIPLVYKMAALMDSSSDEEILNSTCANQDDSDISLSSLDSADLSDSEDENLPPGTVE